MQDFLTLFNSINNSPGLIHIYHKLFGGKRYKTDCIHIICNEDKIGVRFKDQDLYIPMNDVIEFAYDKNVFLIKSDKQLIKVFVNKLWIL